MPLTDMRWTHAVSLFLSASLKRRKKQAAKAYGSGEEVGIVDTVPAGVVPVEVAKPNDFAHALFRLSAFPCRGGPGRGVDG